LGSPPQCADGGRANDGDRTFVWESRIGEGKAGKVKKEKVRKNAFENRDLEGEKIVATG